MHRVKIDLVAPEVDENGKSIGDAAAIKIPGEYRTEGVPIAEVKACDNTIDFSVASK